MSETVTYTQMDWFSIVVAADKDHFKEDVIYQFNEEKREFLSTDKTNSGIYDGS
jgi:hypothetical protein